MDVSRLNAILTMDVPKLSLDDKATPQPGSPSFGQILNQALQQVQATQDVAEQANTALATGQTDDIAGVMIAGEKANLNLSLTIEVRNKLLEAYQEIMRIPL